MNSTQSMPTQPAQSTTGRREREQEWEQEVKAHATITRNRIKEHIRKAQEYRDMALVSERKASRRASILKGQAQRNVDAGQPLLGDQTADDVGDIRAGSDPIWKGHAADNRWHLDQSLVESNCAIMLMAAMDKGLYL